MDRLKNLQFVSWQAGCSIQTHQGVFLHKVENNCQKCHERHLEKTFKRGQMILLSTSDTSVVCYSKMWLFAIQITSLASVPNAFLSQRDCYFYRHAEGSNFFHIRRANERRYPLKSLILARAFCICPLPPSSSHAHSTFLKLGVLKTLFYSIKSQIIWGFYAHGSL